MSDQTAQPSEEEIREWVKRAEQARSEAHHVLAQHERSRTSRVIVMEDLTTHLRTLPVDVEAYFEEAVKCLEFGLTRAAVIHSWSGFVYLFAQRLLADFESQVRSSRNWSFSDASDLMEGQTEHSLLKVAKDVGMITNAVWRELQGLLSKRNRCAHPTMYDPPLNVAIGYVDDIVRRSIKYA